MAGHEVTFFAPINSQLRFLAPLFRTVGFVPPPSFLAFLKCEKCKMTAAWESIVLIKFTLPPIPHHSSHTHNASKHWSLCVASYNLSFASTVENLENVRLALNEGFHAESLDVLRIGSRMANQITRLGCFFWALCLHWGIMNDTIS